MRRLSAEVLFAVRVLGDSRREGIAVLVGGRFIGPACGCGVPASVPDGGGETSCRSPDG